MRHAAGREPRVRGRLDTTRGEAESACAPVLTVYSFFSDTLSPCPANWKQKENGGQGGRKNTEKSTKVDLSAEDPSFLSKTRLWPAETRRWDSAVLRGRSRLPGASFPYPKGAGSPGIPGAGWGLGLQVGWGQVWGGLLRAALGASPGSDPTPTASLPASRLPPRPKTTNLSAKPFPGWVLCEKSSGTVTRHQGP